MGSILLIVAACLVRGNELMRGEIGGVRDNGVGLHITGHRQHASIYSDRGSCAWHHSRQMALQKSYTWRFTLRKMVAIMEARENDNEK